MFEIHVQPDKLKSTATFQVTEYKSTVSAQQRSLNQQLL